MKVTARYGGHEPTTSESVAQSDYTGNLPYFTVSSDNLSPTVGASDAGVAYEVSFG